ncbi:MAG TPA: hypothetical protein VNU70_07610 [Puia sp.]|jgi:hypothetical protein|nr:hypothetical protein [Puia sp.]
MARLGKKILSVFIDNGDATTQYTEKGAQPATTAAPSPMQTGSDAAPSGDPRFVAHFEQLFTDANIPGPDYYEFARMIAAMQAIADERSRYAAAFAGLQVQGLSKEKLLTTAAEYLRILAADADAFERTAETAMQEKVHGKTAAAEEKTRRIQALSQEILELQSQIAAMQNEIHENQEKLEGGRSGYRAESERRRSSIQTDIEKINHYLS